MPPGATPAGKKSAHSGVSRWAAVDLQGQDFAASGTAAGQHLAAVAGRHSLAEAVDFAPLALLGLISSQHFSDFLLLGMILTSPPSSGQGGYLVISCNIALYPSFGIPVKHIAGIEENLAGKAAAGLFIFGGFFYSPLGLF